MSTCIVGFSQSTDKLDLFPIFGRQEFLENVGSYDPFTLVTYARLAIVRPKRYRTL